MAQLALLGHELPSRSLGPLQPGLHVVLEHVPHELQLRGACRSRKTATGPDRWLFTVSRQAASRPPLRLAPGALTLRVPQFERGPRFRFLVQPLLQPSDLALQPLLLVEQHLAAPVDLGGAGRSVGARLFQLPFQHALLAPQGVAARPHQIQLGRKLRHARLQLLHPHPRMRHLACFASVSAPDFSPRCRPRPRPAVRPHTLVIFAPTAVGLSMGDGASLAAALGSMAWGPNAGRRGPGDARNRHKKISSDSAGGNGVGKTARWRRQRGVTRAAARRVRRAGGAAYLDDHHAARLDLAVHSAPQRPLLCQRKQYP